MNHAIFYLIIILGFMKFKQKVIYSYVYKKLISSSFKQPWKSDRQ